MSSRRRLTHAASAALMCQSVDALDPFTAFLRQQAIRRALRDKRAFEIGLQHGIALLLSTAFGLVSLLAFITFGFYKPHVDASQYRLDVAAAHRRLHYTWLRATVSGVSLSVWSYIECRLFYGSLRSVEADAENEFRDYATLVKTWWSEQTRIREFAVFLSMPYATQLATPHSPASAETPADACWGVRAVRHVAPLSAFRRRVRGMACRRRLLVATGLLCSLAQLLHGVLARVLRVPWPNLVVRSLALCIFALHPLGGTLAAAVFGVRGVVFFVMRILLIDSNRLLVLENATLQHLDDLNSPQTIHG